MYDVYNREITYLRISVTDKCNLRCVYCMPEEGIPRRDHRDFMSLEDMARVAAAAAEIGITKVRLTGGEPLVKKGISDLVRMIRQTPGIEHIGMTTNGLLLPRFAPLLKAAGLDSLNISLDTLDGDRYRSITRIGSLDDCLAGIQAAMNEDFHIKINMVVLEDTGDREIEGMRAFCGERGLKLQLINHYDLTKEKQNDYTFDRPPKCEECNRIRLTADGFLKPCLHSNLEIPVDMNNIRKSISEAILSKPEKGLICSNRSMVDIGG